jgi:hypothetical protein
MQKKPSESKNQLEIPEDCSGLDFWFTADGKTFGPFPANLKTNRDRAVRLHGLMGASVELRGARESRESSEDYEEAQRQQKLF